jgi:predicted nucleotidyltransferase
MAVPTEVDCPTDTHRRVLGELLDELCADPEVRGVMLGGSLSRGTARSDSDLDLLVVIGMQAVDPPWRGRPRDLKVDFLVRTAAEWREHFEPRRLGDESWGYAFLDGVVLHDPEGVVAELVAAVPDCHAGYRTPEPIRAHYHALWSHLRPKMAAILESADPVEVGWAAKVLANDVLRTAWAVNDRPNPSLDLGTVRRHLDELTVPTGLPERLRAMLAAAPAEALRRQLDLAAELEPLLSPSAPR